VLAHNRLAASSLVGIGERHLRIVAYSTRREASPALA
jgi:hypothetical protein